jgi:hypothetical protein
VGVGREGFPLFAEGIYESLESSKKAKKA